MSKRGARKQKTYARTNGVFRTTPMESAAQRTLETIRSIQHLAQQPSMSWSSIRDRVTKDFPSFAPRLERAIVGEHHDVLAIEPDAYKEETTRVASPPTVSRTVYRYRLERVENSKPAPMRDLILRVQYRAQPTDRLVHAYAVCRILAVQQVANRDLQVEMTPSAAMGLVYHIPHSTIRLRIYDGATDATMNDDDEAPPSKRQKQEEESSKRNSEGTSETNANAEVKQPATAPTTPPLLYCIRIKCGQGIIRPMVLMAPNHVEELVFELSFDAELRGQRQPIFDACARASNQRSVTPAAWCALSAYYRNTIPGCDMDVGQKRPRPEAAVATATQHALPPATAAVAAQRLAKLADRSVVAVRRRPSRNVDRVIHAIRATSTTPPPIVVKLEDVDDTFCMHTPDSEKWIKQEPSDVDARLWAEAAAYEAELQQLHMQALELYETSMQSTPVL